MCIFIFCIEIPYINFVNIINVNIRERIQDSSRPSMKFLECPQEEIKEDRRRDCYGSLIGAEKYMGGNKLPVSPR